MVSILYVATCKISGKQYAGITRRGLSVRRREHFYQARSGSKYRFHRAIQKYGKNAFEWLVFKEFETYSEAKIAEIEYIASYNPKYNATIGGDGSCGPMSEEGRQRIRLRHLGNTYRSGKTHTKETKEKLRQAMIDNPSHWSSFRPMGPAAMSRKVVCLTTGEEFESASAAARFANCSKSMVIELCNNNPRRKTAKGYVFKYKDAT